MADAPVARNAPDCPDGPIGTDDPGREAFFTVGRPDSLTETASAAATAAATATVAPSRTSPEPTTTLTLAWTALRRGGRPVLVPAEVCLPVGAVVGLVGSNGAGKSTLLMALAGVLERRCGRAGATLQGQAEGQPIDRVGYVPQRPELAPWLSVRGALALLGVDAAAALEAMPSLRTLAPLLDRRADALSGGQTQILAVAGILARGDPLVLLDEPFAGVDLRHRAALVACVGDHRRRHAGSVIVLASHLAADLDALCDWLLVLDGGALVFAGARQALPVAPGEGDEPDGDPALTGAGGNRADRLERRLAAFLR